MTATCVANDFIFGTVFCLVNVNAAKVARERVWRSPVAANKVVAPIRKVTSQRRKGWESAPGADEVCSPGRNKKKKPMTAKSEVALSSGVRALVTVYTRREKGIG